MVFLLLVVVVVVVPVGCVGLFLVLVLLLVLAVVLLVWVVPVPVLVLLLVLVPLSCFPSFFLCVSVVVLARFELDVEHSGCDHVFLDPAARLHFQYIPFSDHIK